MHAQSRRDWAGFEPDAIPTKQHVPQLESWLDRIGLAPGRRLLDVGCGAGEIARRLLARGFDCVGLDINPAALSRSSRECPAGRFYQRDVAAADGFKLDEPPFDGAICQLVLSIVGDAADREQLLRNVHAALRPGAPFFASFSGLSDDLNDAYAQLYARDAGSTEEHGSYWSRDAAGQVLYRTHHFAHDEIVALLHRGGFEVLSIEAQIEASSRRPDQRARFYYADCRRAV
jgi:cyclopropane fatty-acyl-phospholipid synthase-like methyltransferase